MSVAVDPQRPHRVWSMYDVVANILDLSTPRSRARFAQINREYSDIALNVLWRELDGLWPLVRLFSLSMQTTKRNAPQPAGGLNPVANQLHPGEASAVGVTPDTISVVSIGSNPSAISTLIFLKYRLAQISATAWGRFEHYAPRVRSLHIRR